MSKENETMDEKVLVPMTATHKKEIKAKADEMGLPVTAYMRLMALQGEITQKKGK